MNTFSIKTSFLYLGMLVAASAAASTPASVKISNISGDKIYFQPESASDFTRIYANDTVMKIADLPAYYRFMASDGSFVPVYVTPSADITISATKDGVKVTGSNEKENQFIRENVYIARTPGSVKSYSKEWIDYNLRAIDTLDKKIDASGFDPEFAATHKLYNRFTFLNQRLNGVNIAKIFRPDGRSVEVSENFYDFLDTLKFTDDRILRIPKWFTVVNNALEAKESRGLLPVDNDNYMTIYANGIDNDKVRSAYIIELLKLSLKRNYLNDFEKQLPAVKALISTPEALAGLPAIEQQYARQVKENANVVKGTPMPAFTCYTLDKEKYDLSDFRGEYVIVDFWFTGCAPCRAEMPYFDKLAADFNGRGVKFLSLSVDTGDELYAEWEKMMREKPHTPGVISANLPDGFKSPLLKQLNIQGVPRIMLLDREGKIVESYAKRPSDPKLRQQLETLISRD